MIFNYTDYKAFIRDYIQEQPTRGRGLYAKLAAHMGASSVVISQTFNGDRELSLENAFKVTTFLKFNQFETQYFLKLVEYARAGNFELKQFFLAEIQKMQEESKKVKNRYDKTHELSDEDKFTFYSDRYYSSIRMASALPTMNTVEDFAEYFDLSLEKTQEIIQFLLERDLCQLTDGKIKRGIRNTFIPSSSPYIKNHHRNWRLYSIQKVDKIDNDKELMYTAPLSLSLEAYEEVRDELLQTIQRVIKKIGPTADETIACLNIDFLKLN
jgi:uncharacterized protein (TIGR02147 family)